MAVGTWTAYLGFKRELARGGYNLGSSGDTIVATLFDASYTPSINVNTWGDISGEISSGGGYTAGGIILIGQNVTNFSPVALVVANDLNWPSFSASFKYCVLLTRAGGSISSSDKLIGYVDCNVSGGNISGTGAALTIEIASVLANLGAYFIIQ